MLADLADNVFFMHQPLNYFVVCRFSSVPEFKSNSSVTVSPLICMINLLNKFTFFFVPVLFRVSF